MTPLRSPQPHPIRCRPRGMLLACIYALIFYSIPFQSTAQIQHPLEKGVFLVANKKIEDPRFKQAVIIVTQYGSAGAMGIIINKPTKHPLIEALPAITELADHRDVLFMGGPVRPGMVSVLARKKHKPSSMQHIVEDIYLHIGAEILSDIYELEAKENAVRVFAGFCGWAPGQLEHEIGRGDWLVAPGQAGSVFSQEPSAVWRQLIRQWAGTWL